MWEINNGFQVLGFFYTSVLGGVFCLLYDILRAVRRVKQFSVACVFFQDLCYFIIITPVTFCFFLALTNGGLRSYIFIALILGFTLVRLTLSRIFFKVCVWIFSLLFKAASAVKRSFYKYSDRFFGFCKSIFDFTVEKYKKILNCFKKLLKKS